MYKLLEKHTFIAAVVCALLPLCVAVLTGLKHNLVVDEGIWHLPVIALYMDQYPYFDVKEYGEIKIASGPVPYIVWSTWGLLLGVEATEENVHIFRLLSFLLSMTTIFLLYKIVQQDSFKRVLIVLALVVFFPYYFLHSFTIYTMLMSLTFGIGSLLSFKKYIETHNLAHLAGYSLLAALAVASRQIYLSYAAGVIAYYCIDRFLAWQREDRRGAVEYREIVLLLAPLAVLSVLFVIWGGTNAPAAQAVNATRGLNPLQIAFPFVFLGFWFMPVFLDNLRQLPKWFYVVALLLTLGTFYAPLYITEEGVMEGVIARMTLVALQLGVPPFLLKLGQAMLCFAGFSIAYLLVRRIDRFTVPIVALHFGLLQFVPQVWERFYFPVVPVVWISLRDCINKAWIYVVWIMLEVALAIVYYLHKTGYLSL